jgi:hypothetical protein
MELLELELLWVGDIVDDGVDEGGVTSNRLAGLDAV